MDLFRDLINLTLVRLGIYYSVVNLICRYVLTNKYNQLTNKKYSARVNFLLRSRITWVTSTYSVTTESEDLLVVLILRGETPGPKNELEFPTSSGVTGQFISIPEHTI